MYSFLFLRNYVWAWWHTSVIIVFWKQKQVNHGKFQASQPCQQYSEWQSARATSQVPVSDLPFSHCKEMHCC